MTGSALTHKIPLCKKMDEKGGDDRVGVGVASADSNATHNHPQHQEPTQETMDVSTEAMLTLTLVDPPRWGWSAVGGVTDLLSPHEVRLLVG